MDNPTEMHYVLEITVTQVKKTSPEARGNTGANQAREVLEIEHIVTKENHLPALLVKGQKFLDIISERGSR